MYFITICTCNRECYFGDIVEGNIQLSKIGVIADILWHEMEYHAQNIELDEYIIMPNHIHGILIMYGNNDNDNDNDNVETRHALSLPQRQKRQPQQSRPETTIGQQRFQNQGKNTVSAIIGGYKSAVTKHAHRLGFDFAWQPRFYDHIIRDENSYLKISEYIITNPLKWTDDTFNPTNLK
jgi:REP element-mobilizing transposase RayT